MINFDTNADPISGDLGLLQDDCAGAHRSARGKGFLVDI